MEPVPCIYSACRRYAMIAIFGRRLVVEVASWREDASPDCPLVAVHTRSQQDNIMALDKYMPERWPAAEFVLKETAF